MVGVLRPFANRIIACERAVVHAWNTDERDAGFDGRFAFDLVIVAGRAHYLEWFDEHGAAAEVGLVAIEAGVRGELCHCRIFKVCLDVGLVVKIDPRAAVEWVAGE